MRFIVIAALWGISALMLVDLVAIGLGSVAVAAVGLALVGAAVVVRRRAAQR